MVKLRNGILLPPLGQGTWHIGENPTLEMQEIAAIQAGVRAGMTLIDTAEMYGRGSSERLVGKALKSIQRKDVFLVSKVLPENAGTKMRSALLRSMSRMGISYLDLYLYHWRGSVPLTETVSQFNGLQAEGLIGGWGVSNFDVSDMEELWHIPGGDKCLVNQVLYHLGSRGIEFSLKDWLSAHGVVLMAYCPLAQGGKLKESVFSSASVQKVAQKHSATAGQILLAWCIRDGNTIAIPKSSFPKRAEENAAASKIVLDSEDISLLNASFPMPHRKMPLDVQ